MSAVGHGEGKDCEVQRHADAFRPFCRIGVGLTSPGHDQELKRQEDQPAPAEVEKRVSASKRVETHIHMEPEGKVPTDGRPGCSTRLPTPRRDHRSVTRSAEETRRPALTGRGGPLDLPNGRPRRQPKDDDPGGGHAS